MFSYYSDIGFNKTFINDQKISVLVKTRVTELPYCSRCGVEIDFGIDNCPLCSIPIQKFEDDENKL